MCQFQLDPEGMKALLVDAFMTGQQHTAWDEGLRDAVEVPDPEPWAEQKIRELLAPARHATVTPAPIASGAQVGAPE